jgi:NitT/TauT family transport system ATP-binding protein
MTSHGLRPRSRLTSGCWTTPTTSITTLFLTSEIEEAVFLAHRIVVLSRAPARVVATLDNPLPRPRTPDILASPAFVEGVEAVLSKLA